MKIQEATKYQEKALIDVYYLKSFVRFSPLSFITFSSLLFCGPYKLCLRTSTLKKNPSTVKFTHFNFEKTQYTIKFTHVNFEKTQYTITFTHFIFEKNPFYVMFTFPYTGT